jgi:hypothetical protein
MAGRSSGNDTFHRDTSGSLLTCSLCVRVSVVPVSIALVSACLRVGCRLSIVGCRLSVSRAHNVRQANDPARSVTCQAVTLHNSSTTASDLASAATNLTAKVLWIDNPRWFLPWHQWYPQSHDHTTALAAYYEFSHACVRSAPGTLPSCIARQL